MTSYFKITKHTYLAVIFVLIALILSPFSAFGGQLILENKQIVIPGYPKAFNPSCVRWKGKILLSFRHCARHNDIESWIGLCWLDENYEPLTEHPPQLLNTKAATKCHISSAQDARLIVVDDRLFVIYNDADINGLISPRRMYMGEISYENETFSLVDSQILQYYQGASPERWEKNWTPFNYNENLLLSYTISPHRVFQPIPEENRCKTLFTTYCSNTWHRGTIRGGTPAVLDGDEYIALFHSSTGGWPSQYYMAAYTFSSEPPFEITGISKSSIKVPGRIVFPGGLIIDDQYMWVVYGWEDKQVWLLKLDKNEIKSGLIPQVGF